MVNGLRSIKSPTPFFLAGSSGKLFSLYYPPSNASIPQHVVIHVPAFADEMNKSRAMVSRHARRLAERGIGVLVIDLFGTGDSTGDFSQARWETWISDLDFAYQWLMQAGITSISLWGHRLGALLALDFANKNAYDFEHLLLWQPVLDGNVFLMQFLRLRVAATLFRDDKSKETTNDLRNRFKNNQSVEIAGYELHPDLAIAFAALKANEFVRMPFDRVSIFEVVTAIEKGISFMNKKFSDKLMERKIKSEANLVIGDPFWITTEITLVEDLLEDSVGCFTTE